MYLRSLLAGLTIAALATPLAVSAQSDTGASTLRTGLKGRIVNLRPQGVDPERDDAGRINAGYYRLRFVPEEIADATICPRRAFQADADFRRWRNSEDALYQRIFDSKGIWSLTARVIVHNNGADAVPREIRLVAIENPEERNCKIKLAGSEPGDLAILDAASLLVPFNYRNTVYDDTIQVAVRSTYKLEPNGERLDMLWAGLKLFATAASAGLGPIVGAVTPLGKTETAEMLTTDVESAAPILFEGTPTAGQRANRAFVHLAFPPLASPPPAAPKGGMIIALDYQASLFRRGQFYKAAVPITASEVLQATPIPSRDAAAPGLRTVRDALGNGIYDALSGANTVGAFDGVCTIARPALQKLDLSDVDADIYLWAIASTSTHDAVRQNLDKLACFGTAERANLAKMGVKIEKVIIEPVTRRATVPEMHAALTNLGGILQGATADPRYRLNPDLAGRFADRINLVMADDAAVALMRQPEQSGERPRDEVLTLLGQNFSNIGCYAPRADRVDLLLPLRPRFFELPANGRAGAAIALSREVTPRPFILSFGFAPVVDPGPAKVSTILISRRGGDNGEVVREIVGDRRPSSCNSPWMDEVFQP